MFKPLIWYILFCIICNSITFSIRVITKQSIIYIHHIFQNTAIKHLGLMLSHASKGKSKHFSCISHSYLVSVTLVAYVWWVTCMLKRLSITHKSGTSFRYAFIFWLEQVEAVISIERLFHPYICLVILEEWLIVWYYIDCWFSHEAYESTTLRFSDVYSFRFMTSTKANPVYEQIYKNCHCKVKFNLLIWGKVYYKTTRERWK